MREKFQQSKLVYLALGSNIGNRMENLRKAIFELSDIFEVVQMSHVIETDAILLEHSPKSWKMPYLNMVLSGKTKLNPEELLAYIKKTEEKIGRKLDAPRWSPRVIDIDILSYFDAKIQTEHLTIPHKEVKNRDFIQYLLIELGYKIPDCDLSENIEDYKPLNHFVLFPKLVGIVNVTPDSFSDGGCYLDPNKAERRIRQLLIGGVAMIDIGAQSTRPGFLEISPNEEISRLDPVLERCGDIDCLSIDTSADQVVQYVLKKYPNIYCINLQQQNLSNETIKLLADNGKKVVIMLHGTDISVFENKIHHFENCGLTRANIILDPGIGFQKSKIQNIEMIKNLCELRNYGCEIMLAHSRKSFISFFSNKEAQDRDLETIAVSSNAVRNGFTDYLRVHNVKSHMDYFVAEKIMDGGSYCCQRFFREKSLYAG